MSETILLAKTIYTLEQLSEMPLPQIVMAGRSNVGKSSLLNRLTGKKNIAKTSATPGKTRSLNFYRIQPQDFYLVDLPGYGYARCSKTEQDKWKKLISIYLQNNPWIFGVVVLLDARLPPQRIDIQLIEYITRLQHNVLPVMTKADKSKQHLRHQNQELWQRILHLDAPPLPVSSRSGMNIDKLWQIFLERHDSFLKNTEQASRQQ